MEAVARARKAAERRRGGVARARRAAVRASISMLGSDWRFVHASYRRISCLWAWAI